MSGSPEQQSTVGSGRLAGRTAVVVGAGQTPGATIGNGRAVALTFAREGARLVLVDRDPESLGETASQAATAARSAGRDLPDPVTVVDDVASDDAPTRIVEAAVDAYGGFDVLHNNVGIGAGDGPPHRVTDEAFDRIMNVNLRALWRTCRAAVPVLREQRRSAFVNVSSLASIAAATNLTAYKISKAGVNALTQNLALSNARYGLRANAVLPGFIDTPMAVDAAAAAVGMNRADYASRRAASVPLGHQGTAWDVANAALYLASDEAAFVTGICLPVDGGQSARVG